MKIVEEIAVLAVYVYGQQYVLSIFETKDKVRVDIRIDGNYVGLVVIRHNRHDNGDWFPH